MPATQLDTGDLSGRVRVYDTDGRHHHYQVIVENSSPLILKTHIDFQDGPVKEVGANGLTNEALLTVVADRLKHFQSTAYACRENAAALNHVEEALMWLNRRTQARIKQDVEGYNKHHE